MQYPDADFAVDKSTRTVTYTPLGCKFWWLPGIEDHRDYRFRAGHTDLSLRDSDKLIRRAFALLQFAER